MFSALNKLLGQDLNLLFTINNQPQNQPQNSIWFLQSGSLKSDNSPVSVFSFDSIKHRNLLELARNSFKRFKSIKHPLLPKFIDGIETDSKIIFATEFLVPYTDQDPDSICFGLYRIACLLKFFNVDCNLIHGSVRKSNIYITKAGEWKLMGFELLSNVKEENCIITRYASLLPDSMKYASPEVQQGNWSVLNTIPTASLDSWAYGLLIHEIFNGRIDDLGPRGKIPQNLYLNFKNLININPKSRDIIQSLIESATYFDNEYIKIGLFLENWVFKTQQEKDLFIQNLEESIQNLPQDFLKFKVLPELINALEFGGANPKTIIPILKIAKKFNQQEFDIFITPTFMKLFGIADRQVRILLCEELHGFIENFSNTIVSDKLFPNFATGFTDSVAQVREQTLKTVITIIPKLSERLINNDLMRFLAKLQQDVEPGIRTNTTICLGRIAKFMDDSTRKKVLINAFSRSLGDPFPPSRVAGLAAYTATADFYDVNEICNRIIPMISPLLMDPEGNIRRAASKNIEIFLKKAVSFVSSMVFLADLA